MIVLLPEGVKEPLTTKFPVTVALLPTVMFPLGSSVTLTVDDEGFCRFVALSVDM